MKSNVKIKFIFKTIWFYFILINLLACLSFVIVGVTINDWSYIYGFLLYIPFGAISSALMYNVERKKVTKINLLVAWIGRYFLKCIPIIACAILYSFSIDKINIIGILIGVIISLIESIIFCYFNYIKTNNKEEITNI